VKGRVVLVVVCMCKLEFDNSGSGEKVGLGMRPINTVISCEVSCCYVLSTGRNRRF
jgi:hypothetical protein